MPPGRLPPTDRGAAPASSPRQGSPLGRAYDRECGPAQRPVCYADHGMRKPDSQLQRLLRARHPRRACAAQSAPPMPWPGHRPGRPWGVPGSNHRSYLHSIERGWVQHSFPEAASDASRMRQIAGDGPLSHSRETRSATSRAGGAQRRTNSCHSAASAEWEHALARSLTEIRKPSIMRDTSVSQACAPVTCLQISPPPASPTHGAIKTASIDAAANLPTCHPRFSGA